MSNALQVVRTLFLRLRFLFVFIAIGLVVGHWDGIMTRLDRWTRGEAKDLVSGDVEWFCPMHPSVIRGNDKDKCPICFMPLSRRKKGEPLETPAGVLHRLQLSPARIRQAGVATAEIGYRDLVREIRTLGSLEWDERKIAHPSVRVAGRVDELYVNFVGQRIRKGDPLYKLYSPDLVTTQEEYLLALRTVEELKGSDAASLARAGRLAESTRERLRLWGIGDDQIAALEKSKKAETHLVIASPIAGVVTKKDVDIGHYVSVGQDPWTVADDSVFWMQAQVFERDLGLIKAGQTVDIAVEAYPGRPFAGKVAFIAPEVQADSRTARVRVEVPNPDGLLKPGMLVSAVFRVPLGRSGELFYGCCPSCPEIREDAPGKCRKCEMMLVKKGGVTGEEKKEGTAAPATTRKIYVCEVHPEGVSETPGQCLKEGCAGMTLEERKIPPGARLVYACPVHPDVVSEKPGVCPKKHEKDPQKLHFKVVSDAVHLAETWACPMHPERLSSGKLPCPDCGKDSKHLEREELLAVPVSAVIDTGLRKVVFLEKSHGTFDAVEIEVGPRAGEWYPVRKGLAAGDRVVTAGAFLLDAETQLTKSSLLYFGAGGTEKK